MVRERKAVQREAHRLLQAATVEAYGRAGVYVTMDRVMKRADIADQDEYQTLVQYLEAQGWIAAADDDYGIFTLTQEGIDEAIQD